MAPRLIVKQMLPHVLEATTIAGSFKGEDVLLPRIPIFPLGLPFEFKRIQFPIKLSFAMSMNKAQGQSLKVFGRNLEGRSKNYSVQWSFVDEKIVRLNYPMIFKMYRTCCKSGFCCVRACHLDGPYSPANTPATFELKPAWLHFMKRD